MATIRTFILAHEQARAGVAGFARTAPAGTVVTFSEPTRSNEQSAKFHAICSDLARAGVPWMGKARTADQWKVLLVSGHAVATKEGADVVPGIEGEFVNLRESTATMSRSRSSSLIEYAQAFAAQALSSGRQRPSTRPRCRRPSGRSRATDPSSTGARDSRPPPCQ